MATYRKKGKGWEAQVARQGVRQSRSFDTKAQAVAWATKFEAELLAGKNGQIPDKTFSELLDRYAKEVSVKKRGVKWERTRISTFQKSSLGALKLRDLRPADFAEWREARLKDVTSATVNRDMNLLSHACTVAVKEWQWLTVNPLSGVSRPAAPPHRDRRISQDEIERILHACGYDRDGALDAASPRVGAAFLFAIETAMRAGEIIKLTWDKVDLEKRVARLTETKNGTSRNVPLSTEAVRIIKQLPSDADTCFDLTSPILDALFRKAKARAMIENMHFHDTRHEAITRLAKKLDVLDLARMVGHRDLRMLMVYYNATAEELAKRLD